MNDTSRFVTGTEMQFTKRQWQLRPAIRHAAAAVAIGLLLGFLGPFRSGTTLSPLVRYAFWLGLALFGYACVLAAGKIVRGPVSGALRLFAGTLISAVPQTFAAAWALSFVQPGRTFGPLHIVTLFGPVAVVQFGITVAAWAVARRPPPAEQPPAPERVPPFLQRVPARLGRDLVALEAEDHYLRVHTALGSELMLMRLSDALAQLEEHDGLRVHRSWWVAADAVVGTVTKDGRTSLQLRNGLTAPVSRTYLPAVRERRWPPA